MLYFLGSEQQRRWSDCAAAKADLRLHFPHMQDSGFLMTWLIWRQGMKKPGPIQLLENENIRHFCREKGVAGIYHKKKNKNSDIRNAKSWVMWIWAATRQNQQNECAPSEDSDQPDQTAPPVWTGSTLFAQTCLSDNLGSLRYRSLYESKNNTNKKKHAYSIRCNSIFSLLSCAIQLTTVLILGVLGQTV